MSKQILVVCFLTKGGARYVLRFSPKSLAYCQANMQQDEQGVWISKDASHYATLRHYIVSSVEHARPKGMLTAAEISARAKKRNLEKLRLRHAEANTRGIVYAGCECGCKSALNAIAEHQESEHERKQRVTMDAMNEVFKEASAAGILPSTVEDALDNGAHYQKKIADLPAFVAERAK